MKPAKQSFWTIPAILAALSASCASTDERANPRGAKTSEAEGKNEEEHEVEDLERRLDVTRARLEVARLELESYEEALEAKLRHARTEVRLAEQRLARFREAEMPNRLAMEQLGLRSAKDRAQEAADELAQIEIMYEDQDLDDVTAEFVVSRGRRNAERAAERIRIEEAAYRALEERELPEEEERLALALDRARAELASAEREGEIGRRQKEIGVKEAENEVARTARELEEKRAESGS